MLLQGRTIADDVVRQLRNPGDILSLLLILSPDIIQRAFAQLVGGPIAPVAFSFGWVAYSINALLSVFGDGGLMPISDISALVINANGHQRTNLAWVIGRLLRDFEYRADSQGNEQPHAGKTSGSVLPFVSTKGAIGTAVYGFRPQGPGHEKASREALRVTVFEVDPTRPPGRPLRDWIYYLSFAAILVQMGVAAIPWALSMNYMPFVVTLSGAALTLLTSAVPQWGNEKYSGYRTGSWTVSITRGNGSRHVMLILGKDHGCPSGLDLEIMAARSNSTAPPPLTPVYMTVLAALSMMLLITVAGLKEDTWYLLAVGTLGMVQNLVAAGAKRSSSALGIHLRHVNTITDSSVSSVLRKTEQQYPRVGVSLLPVFFSGGMRVQAGEKSFWDDARGNHGSIYEA